MMGYTESALHMLQLDEDSAERAYAAAHQAALDEAWETVRRPNELRAHLDAEWMASYLAEICQCLPFVSREIDGLDKPALQALVKVCEKFEKELVKYVAGDE